VKAATESIAALGPAFMSVTYGAGGGVSHYTLDIAKNLKQKFGIPMLAHLTCVSSSKDTVHQRIEEMKAAGIKNVMALRGDLTPELLEKGRENCDYHYAVELIRELKESDSDFCIGAACYPEKHPESANQAEDIKHLKEKVDAGADFLTTQMVFDNNLFFSFLYKLRDAGVTAPCPRHHAHHECKPGGTRHQAFRLFHAAAFQVAGGQFGSDPEAMKQAGIIYASDQIIDLYANGITNVHVYSMNKPDVAEGILRNVSAILGKNFSA
jgi:5,10-methylenetetrahydrofolate reductase